MGGELTTHFRTAAADLKSRAARLEPHLPAALLAATVLLFLGLYFTGAFLHSLNDDESYYGDGAAAFADGDVMLHKFDTDKPPLAFQTFGLMLLLFGRTEMALKLPSALALAALLIIVYLLGKEIFGKAAGVLAAGLLATSPYLARVGIGAMTDALAIMFLLGALLYAVRGRLWGAGFCVAWALCTRQMAVLFLPIPFLAGWLIPEPRQPLWPLIKRYCWGLFWPSLWLCLWSGLFEMKRFDWFWSEVWGGHVVEGGAKLSPWVRLDYWFGQFADDFFLSPRLWQAAAGCAVALVAFRLLRRGQPEPLSRPAKNTLWLAAGAALYYPLIHTAIGIPLYDRMVFPALPLVDLLAAVAIVRAAAGFGLTGRSAKWCGAALLLVLLVVGMHRNVRPFYQAKDREDVPEVARFIRHLPPGKKAMLSLGLARLFYFQVHGTDCIVPTRPAKRDRLEEYVRHYGDRRILFLLGARDDAQIEDWRKVLAPRYRIDFLMRTSRGLLTLYEIAPGGRFVDAPNGRAIEIYDGGWPVQIPIAVDTIAERLRAYVGVALESAGEPEIRIAPDPQRPLEEGYFSEIRLRATGAVLRRLRTQSIDVEYRNGRLDLLKLFAAGQLHVTNCERVAGEIDLTEADLTAFLQKMNPFLKITTLSIAGGGVRMAGQGLFHRKWYDFNIDAAVRLDANGDILLDSRRVVFAGWAAPALLRLEVDHWVNPTFRTRLDALDLQGATLEAEHGMIKLGLQISGAAAK